MSLEALKAEGHAIPEHVAAKAAALKVNWLTILSLVRQYGPQVVTILTSLLSGTPAGALIAQYGPIAIAVIETVLGGLIPPTPAVG